MYAVQKGATTIWESWDAVKADGSITGSLNHYAYGAVCSFLFETVAGIRQNEQVPGYRDLILEPEPGGSLTFASADQETPHGTVRVSWTKKDDLYEYQFCVPVNSRAAIRLMCSEESFTKFQKAYPDSHYSGGKACLTVGSGTYTFCL